MRVLVGRLGSWRRTFYLAPASAATGRSIQVGGEISSATKDNYRWRESHCCHPLMGGVFRKDRLHESAGTWVLGKIYVTTDRVQLAQSPVRVVYVGSVNMQLVPSIGENTLLLTSYLALLIIVD